ncbi:MAG: ABC transporter ATP-binding protein, partial [Oscillospiraceae bacterium]
TKAAASATRVNEIFEKKSSVFEGVSTENPTKNFDKKISFRNVWFSYNKNEEYAVKGISVDILVGETIGIIGGTGSGKSTFINLIPRFYDVDKGEIFVDGLDVKRYKFSELRSKIGLVPQKAVLFSGTLEENLRWGNENASVEEIWRAIKISQADEFVNRLPDGLQTQILQGGKNLSGGQKQRLTIARALIRKPEILVLDDSASALDFATDAALRGAIQQETENLTVIIVSQRANSIKNADKIIVFDDGEAVGIGTHEELFESCEIYREICLSQGENGVENL